MKPFVIAALTLGVCLTPSFAQGDARPRPEAFQQKMQDRMDKALNLTDAQKASVKDIRAKHKAALETKRKASEDAMKAFREGLRSPDTKVEDLKTLHRTQADANLDLLLEHRAMRGEIRAILTPEQREKAARLEGRMEGRMMGHRGGFGGR